MKRFCILLAMLLLLSFSGCSATFTPAQIAATTLPVYEFTSALCEGTEISVTRVITENVSCLHDYSLSVRQVKAIESAELVILSGAGLEDFMEDLLLRASQIDASAGIPLLGCEHEHDFEHSHLHDADPHIWLSPKNAMVMAQNIYHALCERYPQHRDVFESNLQRLLQKLQDLLDYGTTELSTLSCRELITFHDGFAYFAEAFDLTILKAIEEESGSEASAAELKELILMVREHQLPAVFTEKSGSVSAAGILAAETGAAVFPLDMAMSGESYFDAMYHNIQTVKEALE